MIRRILRVIAVTAVICALIFAAVSVSFRFIDNMLGKAYSAEPEDYHRAYMHEQAMRHKDEYDRIFANDGRIQPSFEYPADAGYSEKYTEYAGYIP